MAIHWGDFGPSNKPKEVTCLDEHLDEVRPKIFRETFASRRPGSLLTHDSVDGPQPLATPPTPNTVEKGNQMWSDFNYKPLPNAQTSSNSKFPTDPASVLKIFRANADEMRIKSESEMREKDTKAPDDNINDSPAKDSKK